jgi:hypothetical protein
MNIGVQTTQSQFGVGYINSLVMVTNGDVYIGAADNVSTAGNNATSLISSTALVSLSYLSPNVFFASGQSTTTYMPVSTQLLSTLVASTGIAPTFCNLTANWRGRLILTQDTNNPQNVYASRLGVFNDFNYAALNDPAAAWAANFSESGQIGEPITAFIPFNDDLAVVSCINSVWLIEGDPSDGGSFVKLSDAMGIVGPRAWVTDAAHTLYFVGTSGLYSLRPFWAQYQAPQNLTDKSWQQFFQSIDRNQNSITLVYDELNQYINIFVTPYNSVTGGVHLIFDIRNGGLWPVQYGGDIGPATAVSFVPGYALPSVDSTGFPIGPTVPQQTIALGGFSSCVYQIDPNTVFDYAVAGNFAISSFANFQAVNPLPGRMGIAHAIEMDMGELPPPYAAWNAVITLKSGAVAADVSDDISYPTRDTTVNSTAYLQWSASTGLDRRQVVFRPRLGGAWFGLQIGNSTASTTWSFEQAAITFAESGYNRYRR